MTISRSHIWSMTARSWLTKHVGEALLGAKPRQEVEDLRLHRGVERRGRLVEQQDLRLQDQRAGDRDALALAAGELVREAEAEGRAEPDVVERLHDALLLVGEAVDGERLGKHAVDRVARVQRGVGVLEHHLHAAGEGAAARRRQRLAVDQDVARP